MWMHGGQNYASDVLFVILTGRLRCLFLYLHSGLLTIFVVAVPR